MPVPDQVAKHAQYVTAEVSNPAELLWNLIIRPPRARYDKEQLGPTHFRLGTGNHSCVRRTDVQLQNPRGHRLQCCLFEPLPRDIWEQSRSSSSSSSGAGGVTSRRGLGRQAAPPMPSVELSVPEVDESTPAAPRLAKPAPLMSSSPLRPDLTEEFPRSASPTQSSVTPVAAAAVAAAAAAAAAVGMPSPERRQEKRLAAMTMSAKQLEPLPCVVFLHGNSSCCLEALPLITLLAPLCIALFCFDFSGCGLSEGEYISLGWYERDDLATCIEYLRSLGRISRIALWGRSMGAVTALMHADRDPSIASLVLDSPFTDLHLLAEELARSYAKLPSWMSSAVMAVLRSIIQSKAHFDIQDIKAIDHVSSAFSPAFFVAAHGDDFIGTHHCQTLYEAFRGEKELRLVEGGHNSNRPESLRREAILFLCRAFHCERLDRLLQLHASGLYDIFTGPPRFPGNGTDCQGSGEDGAFICQQMQVFPAFRSMRLVNRRLCYRPFNLRVSMKLQQDHSEAGLFLQLDPLQLDEVPASGPSVRQPFLDSHTGKTSTRSSGAPRFMTISVDANALVLSQVRDDSVETIAAAAGLPIRKARPLVLDIDRDGNLRIQLGTDAPVRCQLGNSYREQVTIWLMVVRGQTSFGSLTTEDGEATLTGMGNALPQRHLGPTPGRPRQTSLRAGPRPDMINRSKDELSIKPVPLPAPSAFSERTSMPRGDLGLQPPASPPHTSVTITQTQPLPLPRAMIDVSAPLPPSEPLSPHNLQIWMISDDADNGGSDADDHNEALEDFGDNECVTVVKQCITQPEALVGWRVHIPSMGEGLIVGIKRRLGRSTQHIVSWTNDGTATVRRQESAYTGNSEKIGEDQMATAVLLRRKESHKRRCRGLAFEVLRREF